jgi:hypothetical protein
VSTESRPALGLRDATSVVIGAIIGVGIFFSPRDVARLTGGADAALLAWAIGGVIALLGAFTFAELGRLQPRSGGQYHVLRDAYGRAPAFLFVFCNLTAVQAGAVAIIAIICAQNLGVALLGHDPSGAWVTTVSLMLLWALTGLNVLGVRPGARVQTGTVVLKLVTLAALVALAAVIPSASPAPSPPLSAPTSFGSLFAGCDDHALRLRRMAAGAVDGRRGGGCPDDRPARDRARRGRGDRRLPRGELGVSRPARFRRNARGEVPRRRRLRRGVARRRRQGLRRRRSSSRRSACSMRSS